MSQGQPIEVVDEVECKRCTRCHKLKPLIEGFSKKLEKRDSRCRQCHREHRTANKEHFTEIKRRCYYRDIEKTRRLARECDKKRRPQAAAKMVLWRVTDPSARIARSLRASLRFHMKRVGGSKATHTMDLIGCSAQQFQAHIESLWKPGMSWANYGRYVDGGPMTWHIDHKRPCASFDLTDPEQQRLCFHWSNLQPLWAVENMSKGDKITP